MSIAVGTIDAIKNYKEKIWINVHLLCVQIEINAFIFSLKSLKLRDSKGTAV